MAILRDVIWGLGWIEDGAKQEFLKTDNHETW
jgi:hypothetical protein